MIEKTDREKMREEQASDGPDVGGNRPYDYISLDEHKQAEEALKHITKYEDLNEHQIAVLRHQAKYMGLQKDVVDRIDRLELIQCLFFHYENRDKWMAKARELEARLATEREAGYRDAIDLLRSYEATCSTIPFPAMHAQWLENKLREKPKPGQTVCAHGNPDPFLCKECKR